MNNVISEVVKGTDPDKIVALVLNAAYLPTHVISARHAFHCVFTGRAKPMCTRDHYPFDNYRAWRDDSAMSEDQPFLRSAHQVWFVPTMVLANKNMYKTKPRNRKDSLFSLVKRYDFTCQITGRKFKKNWRKHFTREHVIPVAKGGPTEDWNLLPTCREANIKKKDTFPYFDHNGVDLVNKIKKPDFFSVWVDPRDMRSEWSFFPQVKSYK